MELVRLMEPAHWKELEHCIPQERSLKHQRRWMEPERLRVRGHLMELVRLRGHRIQLEKSWKHRQRLMELVRSSQACGRLKGHHNQQVPKSEQPQQRTQAWMVSRSLLGHHNRRRGRWRPQGQRKRQ